jgi:hypothetical protein
MMIAKKVAERFQASFAGCITLTRRTQQKPLSALFIRPCGHKVTGVKLIDD